MNRAVRARPPAPNVLPPPDPNPHCCFLCLPWLALQRSARDDRRRTSEWNARFQAEIWNLRRLLRNALGAGTDKEVMSRINDLALRRRDVEKTFVAWFDLIEVLVQNEECRDNWGSGGAVKKDDVARVVEVLLQSGEFQLPRVPRSLKPLADLAVDWSIDTVVLMTNRYGLWTKVAPPRKSLRLRIAVIWHRSTRLLLPLEAVLARILRAVSSVIHGAAPPEVLSAIKVVRREALIARQQDLTGDLAGHLDWLASHRRQLTAIVEVVFEAVQEAEGNFAVSGRAKKSYVRDLVLATVDELGFTEREGLVFAIADSLLDAMIEVAVHFFNKRGIFRHLASRAHASRFA